MKKIVSVVIAVFFVSLAYAENYFLQEADTENIHDSYVEEATPTSNFGTAASLKMRDNTTTSAKRMFFMFNLSNISSTVTVNESYLRLDFSIIEAGVGAPIAFEVNSTWDESTLTWNNQMDSTEWDDTKMNTTNESSSGITSAGVHIFNVSVMTARAIREGRDNISIMITTPSGGVALEGLADSKEGATPSERPALNLSFTTVVANTVPTHTVPILNSSDGLNTTNANLTGFNQSGSDADSDQIVFNYNWYKNNVTNASRFIDNGSLVLYMPFDENSTQDFSGLGNDGTAVNGANGTPEGKIGGGYLFDGVNDRIDITDSPSINISGSISVGAWVNVLDGSCAGECIVIHKADNSARGNGYSLLVENDKYSLIIGNGTEQIVQNIDTNTGWNYIIGTYDNSTNTASIYKNGVLKASKTILGGLQKANRELSIGFRGGFNYYFNGTIDEVAIYNRSLSASEIMQIYQGTRDGFAVLDSDQASIGENWTIEMTPYDDVDSGIPLNSSVLTVVAGIAPSEVEILLRDILSSNSNFNSKILRGLT